MNRQDAARVVSRLRALGQQPEANWDREYIVFVPSGPPGSPGARLETIDDAELLIHGLELAARKIGERE